MTGPELVSGGLALLAAILLAVVARQRRQLGQALEVADAVAAAATARTGELPDSEPDDDTPAARFARAARELAARGGADADRALLRALVATVHEPVLVHRERIEAANPAFCALLGLEPEAVVGRTLAELVAPDYAGLVESNVRRRLAGEEAPELAEVELSDPHGQVTRLELKATTLEIGGQRLAFFAATEMLPATGGQPALAQPDARARMTLDSVGEGLVTTDAQGRIDFINRAAEALCGVSRADAVGKQLAEVASFVDEHDRRPLPDAVRQCIASGARVSLGRRALLLARATGEERSVEISAAPLRAESGSVAGAVVLLHDVTELRGLTRQMSYQASHDALTGLVNRREFERRLAESVDTARTGGQSHVLCYLDLDRFKAVNDTCGHLAGDNMLREVAGILKQAVRDSDTVARLGGDEFAILLIGCPLQKARQIAGDVCRAVNDYRFVWKDRIFSVGVSVGMVEVSRESGALEDLMSAADSACYVAKQNDGSHVHVYSARDEAVARHSGEIQWLQRLQAALRDGLFELYAQPIVASYEGGASGPGLEVLLRLRDESGRTAAPAEFMQAAERYRLMALVDRWVVQTALSALGSGAIRLTGGKSVSINLSGQTLGDPSFLEFVVETLDHTGVSPSQVCFEVTETSVIGNLELARRFIGVLHGMGCQFALDDFGNDLGAFANLKNLSMDYIKIDGTFTRNLSHDAVNQAMVAAIVRLARTLNFRLIAEQVEDAASLETARGMGIDFAQGYILGRPEPLRTAA
jgi:diguanylate cyclase (GGDEF)-like protein/PAS domain S-box-containing protein